MTDTERPLGATHSEETRRRTLEIARNSYSEIHPAFPGSPKNYQRAALTKFQALRDQSLNPWSYVRTNCNQPLCMRVDCMEVYQPVQLRYPAWVCVYCGDEGRTKDHLLPRAWTGDHGQRATIAVVPSCQDCNSRISDAFAISVTDRRRIAHASLRRKYRKLLEIPVRTEEEIQEFGHLMQSAIRQSEAKRQWILARLAWPPESDYDLRAFQLAGIINPEELGLL